MARAPRKRYEILHNYRVNGTSLEGVRVILIGECTFSGNLKRPDGKALRKSDKTHYLLRFEDKKTPKELGVPKGDWAFSKTHFDRYFALVES